MGNLCSSATRCDRLFKNFAPGCDLKAQPCAEIFGRLVFANRVALAGKSSSPAMVPVGAR